MMAKDEKSQQLCYVFPALTFRTIVITGLNDRTVNCIRVYEGINRDSNYLCAERAYDNIYLKGMSLRETRE